VDTVIAGQVKYVTKPVLLTLTDLQVMNFRGDYSQSGPEQSGM